MWFTRREEGFDDPRHTKRGPSLSLLFGDELTNYNMRLGFSLQLISIIFGHLLFWSYGNFVLFSADLRGLSESTKNNSTFRIFVTFATGIYLLGGAHIMFFQALLSDDSCWARGYRAGSKIVSLASFFDVFSAMLQFIFSLYACKFYTTNWYVHFLEGGNELAFFAFSRILHAICFLLYGCGLFLLEVYHDEGVGDFHAYVNAYSFIIAGFLELFLSFTGWTGICSLGVFVSLLSSTIWAFFFEVEVNEASPALHETELTNDVEQQVELFASKSPYRLQEKNELLEAMKRKIQSNTYQPQFISDTVG